MMLEARESSAAEATRCGLYVHIPFCKSKCGYCDFYSVPMTGGDVGPVIERITRELAGRIADLSASVHTVFIGGGTPTILPFEQLEALFRALSETLVIDDLDEFTVEANPATVDDDKAELLVRAGVNRVSMGAQSFSAAELVTLERRHTPDAIGPSLECLRRHGIEQVNLDLIFGIPGQTLDTWSDSLRQAVELEVDHIAAYGLTYEPGTRLADRRQRGLITPCDEQLEADMYLLTGDMLSEAGYEQYEISNYARPGRQCQHNLIYWHNGPYIGVGPSAAGCTNRRRYKNVSDVAGYVRMMDKLGHAEAESETLDTPTIITELIMMQLRLVEGLSLASFRKHTGLDPLKLFAQPLPALTERGLVTVSDTHIALTRQGRLVADAVIAELAGTCPDAPKSRAPSAQA
ncbi:MAG: radical SAM family heme chaperone HemW [Planctomycetota bacterium]|jgi:oxygen-independent coproporphyrinogen-3 oxidase